MAGELLFGVAFAVGVFALFGAIGVGAAKFGWLAGGRALMLVPIWGIGVANLWVAWRPGDVHEERPIMRLSAVTRGLAMIGPPAVFVVAPDAMSPLVLSGVFVVGMAMSFAVLWLDRGADRKE